MTTPQISDDELNAALIGVNLDSIDFDGFDDDRRSSRIGSTARYTADEYDQMTDEELIDAGYATPDLTDREAVLLDRLARLNACFCST